jgi:hypothetical protein
MGGFHVCSVRNFSYNIVHFQIYYSNY